MNENVINIGSINTMIAKTSTQVKLQEASTLNSHCLTYGRWAIYCKKDKNIATKINIHKDQTSLLEHSTRNYQFSIQVLYIEPMCNKKE